MRNWLCVTWARVVARVQGRRTFWADYGSAKRKVFVVDMHTYYRLYHTFGDHEQPETTVELSHRGLRKRISK